MTTNDPFEYDDAAYALGALAPDERAAFEAHLLVCDACSVRVRELRDVPGLLAGITADELAGVDEPVPDTLLAGLLRRASVQRRRAWWLVGALASVAAACIVTLAVVLWPAASTPSTDGRPVAGRAFTVVGAGSPVRATAELTTKAWGTGIDVHCHYLNAGVGRAFRYDLIVYGRDGSKEMVGSWKLPPDENITFPAGTSLTPSQIEQIEITLADGTPVLRLVT